MSNDKVLEKSDLLAFICETHQDCIEDVSFLCENLKVSRNSVSFDVQTVVHAYGKRYKMINANHFTWSRGKGNTLTLQIPCPFVPLTIS